MFGMKKYHDPALAKWNTYRETHKGAPAKTLKRYTKRVIIIFFFVFISNAVFVSFYYVYFKPVIIQYIVDKFMTGSEIDHVIWGVHSLLGIFELWIFCSASLFIALISILLRMEFKAVNHRLQGMTQDRDFPAVDCLERIRLQHRMLKQVVNHINRIISSHLLVVFAMSVPFIFSLIFLLVSTESWKRVDVGTNVYGAVWCISMLLNVVIITLSGAAISSAVGTMENST